MDSGLVLSALLKDSISRFCRKSLLAQFAFAAFLSMAASAIAQTKVVISLPIGAEQVEETAANELQSHLRILYPSVAFEVGPPSANATLIYLGTVSELPKRFVVQVKDELTGSDSYVVKVVGQQEAVIAGSTPRAVAFAVDALLEKLGFGFYLSYSTAPPVLPSSFSIAQWELRDASIVDERVIFDWHNFLSSCSTWNLDDWQQWITQASRMRFNTIMVHAYGNNPIYSFSFNGQNKPTGYLANTEFGRDWGTEHVLDVRRIIGGDELFDGPVYGADASRVPENGKVRAAEALMQSVFKFAAGRGMGIIFALDVDTESANPQNVIATLPASARISSNGFQLVNPDLPEGYAYYRAEVEQLMKVYPQITQLAVWFRGGLNSSWRAISPDAFPSAWRVEYNAALKANSHLNNDPEAPSMFAISKIVQAFRKALDESGHSGVTLSIGSWRFEYLPAADAFMPVGVGFMPLDYAYEFPSDPVQERLRSIGKHRRIVPIIWAQHDDREFAGRSYVPFAGFGSMLGWSNSSGFGIIHWTTRPLDLFFKSISNQVWTASLNEGIDTTASEMANRTFGPDAQELGKRYLLDWIYDGPPFGRETSDRFLDQEIDQGREATGAKSRLAILESMSPLVHNPQHRGWLEYYKDWERYARGIYEAQSALQVSREAEKAGDLLGARSAIEKADPENAIQAYSQAIHQGLTSRGEEGILITLNLRWLPYFAAQRVALGVEALRVEFAPTHDEPLAQGPGRYTFDFDENHGLIEVLSSSELETEVKEFPAGSLCPNGIEIISPVDLAIGNMVGISLPPGDYSLKLDMPPGVKVKVKSGNISQIASSDSQIDVYATDGKVHITLSPSNKPAFVCGLTLRLAGSSSSGH